MHGYPARNPAHPVLVGGLSLIGGYLLAVGVYTVVLKLARERRRAWFEVDLQQGEYGPVAILSYNGPDGFLRLHEFPASAEMSEAELLARANSWADRLAAL